MKKTIMLLLAFLMMMPCAMADRRKDLEKARNKQVKERLNKWKKDKWEIFGSTNTLEVALRQHLLTMEESDGLASEVSGVANGFKSKNLGRQACFNNACLTYAQLQGSDLQARMFEEGFLSMEDSAAEFEHFNAAYERAIQREIKGEMKESFSIIRQLPDGNYEMETFFIVNDQAASSARLRALENALKESELAQKHASRISDFVK